MLWDLKLLHQTSRVAELSVDWVTRLLEHVGSWLPTL